MGDIRPYIPNFPTISSSRPIEYLTRPQLDGLVTTFQTWYDESPTLKKRQIRGRYWLAFLTLRFTGARLGEVLAIDDTVDIDFRNSEIKLRTLKRRHPGRHSRVIPVPPTVIAEIARYIAEFPEQKSKIFKLDPGNFRRTFYVRAKEASIPKKLGHPHILRHTFAIELLKAGIPVTLVQDLLGHRSLNTTAIYLRISGQEAKSILKEKGLI